MPVDLQRVLALHEGGKMAVAPRCTVRDRSDLALVGPAVASAVARTARAPACS